MLARALHVACLVLALGPGMVAIATACVWDYDTLLAERRQFPTALELITGKFVRHSPELYRWRVDDRRRRIAADPSVPELYDDLAAALDKLGEHDEAIAIMEAQEERFPGRYETQANLGTFLAHAGRLAEALPHIDRALEIDPNAHFGRERYQRWLIEHMLERRVAGVTKLPLGHGGSVLSFSERVLVAAGLPRYGGSEPARRELERAVEGVLGMMRFGNHASPVLLEALGDLLVMVDHGEEPRAAKQLAARAYLTASMGVSDPAAVSWYRQAARDALALQLDENERPLRLEQVEAELLIERSEAEAWFAQVRADELRWIADPSLDPDAEFAARYFAEPELRWPPGADAEPPANATEGGARWRWVAAGGALVVGLGLLLALGAARRRS
jgi:tetratricopeptide (TPR) repeat protein